MASFRKRGRVWYFRFSDADGVKRERRGCPDRRATEEMARHAESMASRIREGTLEPEALERAASRNRPIRDHLDDFIKLLSAKGKDPKHVSQTTTYAGRILDLSGIQRIADL